MDFSDVGIAKVSQVKWTFIFSNPLIFHRVTAIQVLQSTNLKKNWVFFFPKNNQFGEKSLMETESLFGRAISLYFLFFLFSDFEI